MSERFVTRGKNPQDDPIQVKNILIKNKEYILKDGKLRPPSDDIWNALVQQNTLTKTPKALYTFVACNKWDIKFDLGILQIKSLISLDLEEEPIQARDKEFPEECLEPEEFQVPNSPKKEYKIFIDKEKWKVIEPQELIYRRKPCTEPQREIKERKYLVLKPGIWADVINGIIWDTVKWPCSWSFKGNYISTSENAKYWLAIRGRCGCGNELLVSSVNRPSEDPVFTGLSLDLHIWGEKEVHEKVEGVRKRPCTGEIRRKLGAEIVDKNLKATRMRKLMASSMMDLHDPYPAHLPTNEVVRKIKSQTQKSRRIDSDPLIAIQLMKYSTNHIYQFSIKEIGLDPFFVHLCTPDQLKVYNMYCKTEYSRLIIDASGKLVRKLSIPGNAMSGNIFLYLGVVRITGTGEGLIPVVQMLSERHNSNALSYWLAEWIRGGATIPCEVITDDSAALISAVCKALAGEPNTATYLSHCLQFLQGNNSFKPSCLIRLDIAHFTNMVRKWPEIVQMTRRTKEFYIRVIVLVAKALSLEEARIILKAIFVVSLSETEGNSVSNGQPTMCEHNKKMLLAMISGMSIEEDEQLYHTESIFDEDDRVDDNYSQQSAENPTFEEPTNIKEWVENIEKEVLAENNDDGDRDNIMFSPIIMKKVKKLCYILPLWCSALPEKMNSPFSRAIGAYVEGEFSNIKNNLIRKDLRVDDFIKEYLTLCDGSIKLSRTIPSFNENPRHPLQTSQVQNTRSAVRIPSPKEKATIENDGSTFEPSYNYGKEINTPLLCPACLNNDHPSGAHKCKKCGKAVHAIDGCSYPLDPDDEGYGEERLCVACSSNQRIQNTQRLITKTGIVDRPDITLPGPSNVENTCVEGWKGKSLPNKKITPAFYWRPNPDFPMLQNTNKSRHIGILKNGHSPSLKVLKVENNKVLLSNTCGFDALCQLFAAAYCDSSLYREKIDEMKDEKSILQIAKHIVVDGINRGAYQKRAEVLFDLISPTLLKGGIVKLDCTMDASALLRKMKIQPSLQETLTCSSPHCPLKNKINTVIVISANVPPQQNDLRELQEGLISGEPHNHTYCLQLMTDIDGISPEHFIMDGELSKLGPLCSGSRTRKVEVGPHLIIEVISGEERLHTGGAEAGVLKTVKSSLDGIQKTVNYLNVPFNLRGVVIFTPPSFDCSSGHYRAVALRSDLTWEVYDDLREKVSIYSGKTVVNVHTLVFTI